MPKDPTILTTPENESQQIVRNFDAAQTTVGGCERRYRTGEQPRQYVEHELEIYPSDGVQDVLRSDLPWPYPGA